MPGSTIDRAYAKPSEEREAVTRNRRELADLLGEQYATHKAVTPMLALVLERLYTLRRAYLDTGRGREAHGVSRAIKAAWHTIVRPHTPPPHEQFSPTLPMGFDGE